jgi:diacylglycerol kinase family enzyme/membrane-associated phospholipid phosphatase
MSSADGGKGAPMDHETQPAVRGWGRVQRRVRRLAPAPIRRLDLAVFRTVARTDLGPVGPVLPRLSTAANHSRLWMVLALGMAVFGGRQGKRAAVRGLASLAVTSAGTNLPAKLLAGRTRPDLRRVPAVRRVARLPSSTSFPSGHSASAVAFATGAGLELPALRPVLRTLAGAVAFSRVYTGVHYPGDVVVGAGIGAAVARASLRPFPLLDPDPARAAEVDDIGLGEDGAGLVIVVNDGAGHELQDSCAHRLRDALPAARIVEVGPDDDLVQALRDAAADGTALGVAGGDGTVSAAAAVAHEAGTPLAVVPAGTLNYLAKALGLDEEGAIDAVRRGRAVAIDLADVDGEAFVNALRVGLYADVVAEREQLEDRLTKWPAALVAVVRVLTGASPLELEVDGRPHKVWAIWIGNCRFWPHGIGPSQRRRLDDGQLDVRMVLAEVPWSRTRVVWAMLTGGLARCTAYRGWVTTSISIRSASGPLRVVADGEVREAAPVMVVDKRERRLVVFQP